MEILRVCKRCGNKFNLLKRYGFRGTYLCMKCLFNIVDEWDIKVNEFTSLQDSRNFCSINECTYEINHAGNHSWEIIGKHE